MSAKRGVCCISVNSGSLFDFGIKIDVNAQMFLIPRTCKLHKDGNDKQVNVVVGLFIVHCRVQSLL